MKKLLHEKNLLIVKSISELSIKDKRKVFTILRKLPTRNHNIILPKYLGITLGEFCTVQVLLTDSKRKLKDFLNEQYRILNLDLFEKKSLIEKKYDDKINHQNSFC